jgi:hypothetical protein
VDAETIQRRQDEFSAKLSERLKSAGVGVHATPPSRLYHYTTADGLKGIIENDVIWATNFRYVNDLAEYVYAKNLLEDEIRRRIPSAPALTRAVLDTILGTPDGLLGVVDIFIACFCEDGDLLSQWRAYGGVGGGYAIGFGDLKVEAGAPGAMYRLFKVDYDKSKQEALIRFLLDEFCSAVEELGAGIEPAKITPPVIYSHVPPRVPNSTALS